MAFKSVVLIVHSLLLGGTLAQVTNATSPCSGGSCANTTAPPDGLFPCTGANAKWDGITYMMTEINGTSGRYWGPCGFPNPYRRPEMCGQDGSTDLTHACDPDKVLNGTRQELSNLTAGAVEYMPTITCDPLGEAAFDEKVQIVVALVKRMRVVNMDGSICQDDCGQVVPFQSAGSTNVSEEEIVLSSQVFAQVLDAQWDIGSCDNDVVIFFVEEYGKIASSVGTKALPHVPKNQLDQIITNAQTIYNTEKNAFNALSYIIKEIDTQFGGIIAVRGSTPAYLLLTILGALIVVFLLGWGCTYYHGRVSDYWDEQWWEATIRILLYICLGLFIIEGIIWGLVLIQQKVRVWWIIIPLVGLAGSVVAIVVLHYNGYQW